MGQGKASRVRLRPFRIEDAADVCRIYPMFFVDNAAYIRGGRLTVAEALDAVVGIVLWAPGLEPAWFDPGVARWVELVELHVHPRLQNRGIGTRLVRAAIRQARDAGYRAMYLDTDATNATARRVYERCGFREHRQAILYKLEL